MTFCPISFCLYGTYCCVVLSKSASSVNIHKALCLSCVVPWDSVHTFWPWYVVWSCPYGILSVWRFVLGLFIWLAHPVTFCPCGVFLFNILSMWHFVCVAFCLCGVFSEWRLVQWHFSRVAFWPVTFCLCCVLSCDILSCDILFVWRFVCDILSCGIVSCDILSYNRLKYRFDQTSG